MKHIQPGKKRPIFAAVMACLATSAVAHGEENTLPEVTVKETLSVVERYKLPQTTESVTAKKIAETVNVVDTEDALKYMPSLFVRKRNSGDTQPVLATRTWGVNSSARSLVYADNVLISALLANNNTLGAPRWGLVAPEEIERVDVMYGPFAAAYSGNSMGAVVQITTRMPEKFEASLSQTEAFQNFSQYGTNDTFRTEQTSATIGNRSGDLSWWISGNHQNSFSQPLSYVTNGSTANPTGTTGTYPALNKLGAAANVVGASGLLHTQMDNLKVKVAYDLTPTLRATYTLGLWRNDADSSVQTYLTANATGQPTYGSVSGFASGYYTLLQEHSMHSLALKSNTKGEWDWEAAASVYNMDKDVQKTPSGVSTGTTFTTNGKAALLEGTGWSTFDLKGIWRPGGKSGAHEASFGAHRDLYKLVNPTYNTSDWAAGNNYTSLSTDGRGKTETTALWGQDVWNFAPGLKATLGGRYEWWRAFDGYNYNSTGATSVTQPGISTSNFSPKASVAWEATPLWLITGSVGKAYRYPTVAELYQLISTGSTYTSPNANLKPEQVLSEELVFERELPEGKLRVSLFQEEVSDALISQTALLDGATPRTFVMNVDKVRFRGIELALQKNNVFVRGLELSGSLTYVDSKILADSNWASSTGTTAVGKRTPYVPDWRATVAATYRPDDKLATTVAARYSGKQYSTMDNTDTTSNVYTSFDGFMVVDARVRYQVDKQWAAAVGIDNLNNRKYVMYHPFPQRTLVANLKYSY